MTLAELVIAERKANSRLANHVRRWGSDKAVTLAAADAAFWAWRDLAKKVEARR